jgi:hypothetical protein
MSLVTMQPESLRPSDAAATRSPVVRHRDIENCVAWLRAGLTPGVVFATMAVASTSLGEASART